MDTGKWIDELTMLAFDDRGQFDVLESSLATCDKGSESTFLWQLAVGLAVDPASAVIDALHRSAVHSGNTRITVESFILLCFYTSRWCMSMTWFSKSEFLCHCYAFILLILMFFMIDRRH